MLPSAKTMIIRRKMLMNQATVAGLAAQPTSWHRFARTDFTAGQAAK
jgi:hypothetical protein